MRITIWLDRHPKRKAILLMLQRLVDYLGKCPHERLSRTMVGQACSCGQVVSEWAYKICLDCGIEILQPHKLPEFVKKNRMMLLRKLH